MKVALDMSQISPRHEVVKELVSAIITDDKFFSLKKIYEDILLSRFHTIVQG